MTQNGTALEQDASFCFKALSGSFCSMCCELLCSKTKGFSVFADYSSLSKTFPLHLFSTCKTIMIRVKFAMIKGTVYLKIKIMSAFTNAKGYSVCLSRALIGRCQELKKCQIPASISLRDLLCYIMINTQCIIVLLLRKKLKTAMKQQLSHSTGAQKQWRS